MSEPFTIKLDAMQPSQLYISSAKLAQVTADVELGEIEPVPVKKLDGETVMTDGHTRALVALLAGAGEVQAVWDTDELDWEAYRICVAWCKAEGVRTIADLRERIVGPAEYEALWHERCREMHRQLAAKRRE